MTTDPEVRQERRQLALEVLFAMFEAIFDQTELAELQEALDLDENEALEVLAEIGTAQLVVCWEDDA